MIGKERSKVSITDSIADALTMIRNASRVKQEKVDLPASKLIEEILRILKEEGFIATYKKIPEQKQGILRAYLKFTAERKPAIRGIKRVSKPGLRIYAKCDEIPTVLGGLGVAILSTPKGVLTDKGAKKLGVGGEVLCYVW